MEWSPNTCDCRFAFNIHQDAMQMEGVVQICPYHREQKLLPQFLWDECWREQREFAERINMLSQNGVED